MPVAVCVAVVAGADGAAGAGGVADGVAMAAKLAVRFPQSGLGPGSGGAVLDAASGRVLWAGGADTGRMPASSAKLATAVTALTVLGPDRTERTTVRYRAGDGTLCLIAAAIRCWTYPSWRLSPRTPRGRSRRAG
ncbi:hypothetical protein GXW82_16340 [Streptacidiphilus sp. 4-A2]|nr:hypothetical protein [Streptacidiphilus sp. 4-A2]